MKKRVKKGPVVPRLALWFDDRLGGAGIARKALQKIFPDHWSFILGEIALYCFMVLVGTGVFLTFFFEPNAKTVVYQGSYAPLVGVKMSSAYRSSLDISFDVRAGLVMRQAHHWAALLFLASITAHLFRVWFTGAYRRPREINWMVGLTLMLLALVNGFFGYSLLDDQLSGSGLRIVDAVILSIPVGGTWIASLLYGGDFPGTNLLERFYAFHVLLIPAIITFLVVVHMAILIRHKHAHFPGNGATDENVVGERLWPTYAAKATSMLFITAAVIFILGGLVQINPIWLFGPYRVGDVSAASQPDWYMGWLDGALRIMPPWETRVFGYQLPNPFFPAVLLPGLLFGGLYGAPFIEARYTKDRAEHHVLDRPRHHPLRTGIGVASLAFYLVLLGSASGDVLSTSFGLSVNTVIWLCRVALLVLPIGSALIARRICYELQARDEPHDTGFDDSASKPKAATATGVTA